MAGLFVTGTDTGVGKTVFTYALARQLEEAGLRVGCMKPVATGASKTDVGLVCEDTRILMKAMGSKAFSASDVTPFAYEPALAPSVAARQCGQAVDLDVIADTYSRMAAEVDFMLVEGIGGAMVPLGGWLDDLPPPDSRWGDVLVSDMCAYLGLSTVLVARDVLGTISHTLLTVDHLERRGITVQAVVLNQTQAPPYQAELDYQNADEIERAGCVTVLGPLAYAANALEPPSSWADELSPLVKRLFHFCSRQNAV